MKQAFVSNTEVDTLGWDTAYMASYAVVNSAIIAEKSSPTTFSYTDDSGIIMAGTWAPWQLTTGGSGPLVHITCVVESGAASGAVSGDLTGTSMVVQFQLTQKAAAAPVNDPTAKPGTGTAQTLVVNTEGVGEDPAAVVTAITFPAGMSALLKDLLQGIFSKYFQANIGAFDHTFAVMNINEVADKDGFQWLKPSAFGYAVGEPQSNKTLDNCAFGLVAMVDGGTVPPTLEVAIDSRALLNLPAGANSAFVISQNMVAQHMLLNGAISVIQGSTAGDFIPSSDGLSVTNLNSVTWGNFQTDSGIISPVIAANNFTMRADDTYVYLEIVNANYEPSPGVTVHMNLTQKFSFNTVKAKNGNYVFIPDITGFGNPQVTASVSVSEALQIVEIIAEIVGIVVGLLAITSFIAGRIAALASVTTDEAANTGSIVIDAASVEEAAASNPEELANANELGAEDADEGAINPTSTSQVQKGGIFTSTQFRTAVGLTGTVSGLTIGGIALAKYIVSQDYDNIPAFDGFAANCLGASVWPGTQDYTLLGASFRSSLVMGMALNAKSPA